MYIVDYKNKTVAKFDNKELSEFLNAGFKKNRYLFSDNKQEAKRIVRLSIAFFTEYKIKKVA